jgi:hypothetical protein
VSNADDQIAAAIQARLDEYGDGWTLGQWVVGMSIERIDSDGQLETIPWRVAAPALANWQTDALLFSVSQIATPVNTDE